MRQILIIFCLLFGANAFPQENQKSSFVLDQSKPYVYLQFDHIGPRKPLQKGEGETGLWLRVVNNCRIPIAFLGSNASPGEPGFSLFHDVVAEEPYMDILYSRKEVNDAKKQRKARLLNLKHKPDGYSDETSGIIIVQPGKEILFSVPRNHVSDDWFLRVKFALKLNPSSAAVGPFTYLPFSEIDIPREFRQNVSAPSAPSASQPANAESPLLHELGHADPPKQQ
jgi:hypothetical protein